MATVKGVFDDLLMLVFVLVLVPVVILVIGAPLALLVRMAIEIAERLLA